jgi:hypothetical protein
MDGKSIETQGKAKAMRVQPRLTERLVPGESLWSWGHKSRDAATESAWDDISEGTLSHCEKPREIAYRAKNGKTRWAVAILVDSRDRDIGFLP